VINPRLFHGWRIVAAGFVLEMLMGALLFHACGAYVVLLRQEFGWSKTLFSAAFSMARAESGILGPIQGVAHRPVRVRHGVLGRRRLRPAARARLGDPRSPDVGDPRRLFRQRGVRDHHRHLLDGRDVRHGRRADHRGRPGRPHAYSAPYEDLKLKGK
jgi:hypothetical protein